MLYSAAPPRILSIESQKTSPITSQFNVNYSDTNLSNLNRTSLEIKEPSRFGTAAFSVSTPRNEQQGYFDSQLSQSQHRWYERYLLHVDLQITVLCTCWYLVSMISSNTTKFILENFKYPITLTQFQFTFNFSYCILILSIIKHLHKSPTMHEMIFKIFPVGFIPNLEKLHSVREFMYPTKDALSATLWMGIFQFTGHISSHKATSLIPVSIVHTVKALAPLFIVLFNRLFLRSKYKFTTYFTLFPLIGGIMLSCYNPKSTQEDFPYYTRGLVYAFLSMLIFVTQNISSKRILSVEDKTNRLPLSNDKRAKKFDKLTILFFCSVIGFCFTLPIYIYSEFQNDSFSLFQISPYVMVLLTVNGLSHFLQSLVAFQILGKISSVNYSIANLLKRVVIIAVSLFIERKQITSNQTYGFILTMVGLYSYEKWGQK